MVVASAVVKGTTAAEGGVPARRPGVGHAALRRGRYRSATVVVVLATGLLGGTASGAPLQVGRSGPAGHEAGLHPSLRSPAGPTTAPVPRSSTLYTSGTALSPPRSFDPLSPTAYTGAQGLLYEPLFLYDPVKEQLMPWLASAGRWVTPTSYVLRLRPGERWVSSASGRAEGEVSGADVAYSLQLARTDVADPYHGLVGSVRAVSASGGVVTVTPSRAAMACKSTGARLRKLATISIGPGRAWTVALMGAVPDSWLIYPRPRSYNGIWPKIRLTPCPSVSDLPRGRRSRHCISSWRVAI